METSTPAAQLEAMANSSARAVLFRLIKAKAEAYAKANPQPKAMFLIG